VEDQTGADVAVASCLYVMNRSVHFGGLASLVPKVSAERGVRQLDLSDVEPGVAPQADPLAAAFRAVGGSAGWLLRGLSKVAVRAVQRAAGFVCALVAYSLGAALLCLGLGLVGIVCNATSNAIRSAFTAPKERAEVVAAAPVRTSASGATPVATQDHATARKPRPAVVPMARIEEPVFADEDDEELGDRDADEFRDDEADDEYEELLAELGELDHEGGDLWDE
jgi:hypothetical protein